jgi:hypothetical protein
MVCVMQFQLQTSNVKDFCARSHRLLNSRGEVQSQSSTARAAIENACGAASQSVKSLFVLWIRSSVERGSMCHGFAKCSCSERARCFSYNRKWVLWRLAVLRPAYHAHRRWSARRPSAMEPANGYAARARSFASDNFHTIIRLR